MHRGYVKLWRRLKDNEFWLSERFSDPQAWVDLLMLANHKPTFFIAKGRRIDVDRGQLAFSEVSLAERWKWSRGKVRRFLRYLSSKTVQQIVQQKNNVTTLISIQNWDQYQVNGTADGTAGSTADGTHLKKAKNKEKEKINKKEKDNLDLSGEKLKSNGFPWIDPPAWDDFVEHRREIKKPLSDLSAKKSLELLSKFKEQQREIIDNSIRNSWQGLFAPKAYGNLRGVSAQSFKPKYTDIEEYQKQCDEKDAMERKKLRENLATTKP